MEEIKFEWDHEKDIENFRKHKVPFGVAQLAFLDPRRVIIHDFVHSVREDRYYLMGRVGDGIITVRFTYRGQIIRIIGAGFWRKGRKIYEEENNLY